MYSKEDVMRYEGKFILCIKDSNTYSVTKGKFYKIIETTDFGENTLLINIYTDWDYDKIYGTIPFYLNNLHEYFELKTIHDVRKDKIKSLL